MAQLNAWAVSVQRACKDLWNGYTDLAHFRAETNQHNADDLAYRSPRVERLLRSTWAVYYIRMTTTDMLKDLWICHSSVLHKGRIVPRYQIFAYRYYHPRDDTVERLADWLCPLSGPSVPPLSDEAIMATATSMTGVDPHILFGLAAYLLQRRFPSPETLPLFISVENWLRRRRLFDFAKYHRSLICVQGLVRKKLPIWRERREAVKSLLASTTFLADDLKPIVFGYVGGT